MDLNIDRSTTTIRMICLLGHELLAKGRTGTNKDGTENAALHEPGEQDGVSVAAQALWAIAS
jgi:hypothetical protein